MLPHAPPTSRPQRRIRPRPRRVALLLLALSLCRCPSPLAQTVTVASSPDSLSLADFQARLQFLDKLVAQCQAAITEANCNSSQVGSDIQLALPQGSRQIRLAWLRNLLDSASDSVKEHKDQPKTEPASTPSASPSAYQPPSLPQQLAQARTRLAAESELAAELAKQPNPASGPNTPQRQTLERILAAKEYHPAVAGPSPIERAFEKIGNWIDTIIGKLEQAGFRSKWVGRTAEILFLLALSIGLIWYFLRLERQGRIGIAPILPGPGGTAASARDWQLWMEDARLAASHAAWRDAIHLLYWASISRLESLGFWPADRARTPREYLALLAPENAHHAHLKQLTRSFERTWYGGRSAAESDFRQAAEIAAKLGAKSPSSSLANKAGR